MTRRYRVRDRDHTGEPIGRLYHGKLGLLEAGKVLELDEAIGDKYLGTLLVREEQQRAAPRRKVRVLRRGTAGTSKGDEGQTE